jgi:hypothetical protein
MNTSWLKRVLKSKSRPAARRRPARVQLGVEALETRVVPAVHAFVNGSGSLEISTDVPGTDNVTINRVVTPTGAFVTVNGTSQFLESKLNSIHILDGFFNVSVQANRVPVTVENVEDHFFVGNGTMQDIREGVFLTSANTVVLDDSADFIGRNITMQVHQGFGFNFTEIDNMAPGQIFIGTQGGFLNSNPLQQLSLFGGGGHNTFNILDTPAAFVFFQKTTHTTIHTGFDGDTVNVRRTTSVELDILGTSGRDTVNIGNNGSLQGIQSFVTVKTGSFGARGTALSVDGSADTSSQNVFMGQASDDPSAFTINGLLPGNNTIEYDRDHTNSVNVKGSKGAKTYTVDDTVLNSTTELDTGAAGTGSATVIVHNTHGQLILNSLGGHDTVNIGHNHSLRGIQGAIHIFNTPSFSTVNIDESADNVNHAFQFYTSGGQGVIDGLGFVAPIFYNPGDITSITLTGDQGREGFEVESTVGGFPITINAPGSSATFIVGFFTGTLDHINNPLTLNGSPFGFDTLQVIDTFAATGHLYSNDGRQITRDLGAVTINYSLMNSVTLEQSPLPPHITFIPDPGFPAATDLALTDSIRAGQRATLSGRLTDADPREVLSLTVVWGDGSPAEQSTPDRAPFRLTHRYDTPGTYKVRVTWTDSFGRSNFQELTLTVQPARHGEHDGDGESGDHDADAVSRLDAFFGRDGDGDYHDWREVARWLTAAH